MKQIKHVDHQSHELLNGYIANGSPVDKIVSVYKNDASSDAQLETFIQKYLELRTQYYYNAILMEKIRQKNS